MFCLFARFEESVALKIDSLEEYGSDLVVNFPKGKTYQYGECRESVILTQSFGEENPVLIIKSYLSRLNSSEKRGNWLFPAIECKGKKIMILDEPVSYDALARQLKSFGGKAGLDCSIDRYGTHSFRRGGVTTAVNNGCSEHVVQKQMRVASSSTVARYATLSRVKLAKANGCLAL